MAGFLGLFQLAPLSVEDKTSLEAPAHVLDYTGESQFDRWITDHFCLWRVFHSHESVERPYKHRNSSISVIIEGDIVDPPTRSQNKLNEKDGLSRGAAHCLELYERHGVEAFTRVNGTFNIILHDEEANSIAVASDRFASHPLYYVVSDERLYFSSQIAPLLKLNIPRRLDMSAVRQFFVFQTIRDDRTFLKDIKLLPPACILRFPSRTVRPRRYWSIQYNRDENLTVGDYAEGLANALAISIQRQTRNPNHMALLLSGGLDSRTVLACVSDPITAITIADFENREVKIAKQLAATRSCPFIFIPRPLDTYPDLVEAGVMLGDGSYRFDHAHFAPIRKLIPNEIQAVTSGYGFDFLLKGSTLPSRSLHLAGWPLNHRVLVSIPDDTSNAQLTGYLLNSLYDCLWNHGEIANIFAVEKRSAMREDIYGVLNDLLTEASSIAPSPVEKCEYVPLRMMFARAQHFLNLLGIRNFFTERTIVFDNNILDEVLRIPPTLRLNGYIYKKALKLLQPKLFAIPDANTGLFPGRHFVIQHLRERAEAVATRFGLRRAAISTHPAFSQGSWPNMGELIRHNPKLRQRLFDLLDEENALSPDIFDITYIKNILRLHIAGSRDSTWVLLLLLTFGTWFRRVFSPYNS